MFRVRAACVCRNDHALPPRIKSHMSRREEKKNLPRISTDTRGYSSALRGRRLRQPTYWRRLGDFRGYPRVSVLIRGKNSSFADVRSDSELSRSSQSPDGTRRLASVIRNPGMPV